VRPSILPPDQLVTDWPALVYACGGQPPDRQGEGASFTGRLLDLIQRADPQNLRLLALAYPGEVIAWRAWRDVPYRLTSWQLTQIRGGMPPGPPERITALATGCTFTGGCPWHPAADGHLHCHDESQRSRSRIIETGPSSRGDALPS
jgi:hypothetical protein